jgi:hypothetical protein
MFETKWRFWASKHFVPKVDHGNQEKEQIIRRIFKK